MKRLLRKRWVRWIFGIVLAVVLAHYAREWFGEREWQRYAAGARARGSKLTLEELIPKEPIPDEENFAAMPIWKNSPASKLPMTPNAVLGVKARQPPKTMRSDIGRFRQAFVKEKWAPSGQEGESDAAVILQSLTKIEPYFHQLRTSASRTRSRYPVDWSQGFYALPDYSNCLAMSRWLELKITAELDAGKIDEALADWKLGCALARSLREEPAMIAHLVERAVQQKMLNAVGEGIERDAWTDAELLQIESELAAWNVISRMRFALESERAFINTAIERFQRAGDPTAILGTGALGNQPAEWLLRQKMKTTRWWRQNQIWLNAFFDEMLTEFDATSERWKPATARKYDVSKVEGFWQEQELWLAKTTVPGMDSMAVSSLYDHAMVRMAGLACALERHRRARGAYPEILDELIPGFVKRLPHDPCTGEPFIYRPDLVEGYLLYSTGENRKDDQAAKGEGRISDRTWPDWRWWAPSAPSTK